MRVCKEKEKHERRMSQIWTLNSFSVFSRLLASSHGSRYYIKRTNFQDCQTSFLWQFGQKAEQQQQQPFNFVARLFWQTYFLCQARLWVRFVLALRPLDGHLGNPGRQMPFECTNDGLFNLSRIALRWQTAVSPHLSVVNNSHTSNA